MIPCVLRSFHFVFKIAITGSTFFFLKRCASVLLGGFERFCQRSRFSGAPFLVEQYFINRCSDNRYIGGCSMTGFLNGVSFLFFFVTAMHQ